MPSPRRRSHHERRLQIYLVKQFRRLVPMIEASLIALENGEDRGSETLGLLGALGVLSGWPDLALVMRDGRVHWIEVKLESNREHKRTELRDDQREIHARLRCYDHLVSTVRNADEFWAIVDRHGIEHAPRPARHEQLMLPRPRRRPVKRGAQAA